MSPIEPAAQPENPSTEAVLPPPAPFNPINQIALIETVDVKKAFPKEAINFTPWLENNIAALSQRLNLTLKVIAREKVVGSFYLDLLCEDSEGRQVIIENQLEKSDHTHLGQVLTYLVNLNASTAIWITPEPRAEHLKVINWLNESTPAAISFYLVKVETIKIQNSPYAPLFTVIAGPDQQSKVIGDEKKEWDARQQSQFEFWKSFIEQAKAKIPYLLNKTPPKTYYLSIPGGKSGSAFIFNVYADRNEVELYIDAGKNSQDKNKLVFDKLWEHRAQIEQATGPDLIWERQDNERASHLRFKFKGGYQTPPASLPAIQQKLVNAFLKLESGLKPFLNN